MEQKREGPREKSVGQKQGPRDLPILIQALWPQTSKLYYYAYSIIHQQQRLMEGLIVHDRFSMMQDNKYNILE